MVQAKIKFKKIPISDSPFGVAGGNYVYHIGESYFSYNPNPNNNIIDKMFGVDTGEETAFYNSKNDSFIILLGDFRQEIIEENIRTHKQAIAFCKKRGEYLGEMTTDDSLT